MPPILLFLALWVPRIVHPVKDDATHEMLRQAASEPDRVVRSEALGALRSIADPADRSLIEARLQDPVPAVRDQAAAAAVTLGYPTPPAPAAEPVTAPLAHQVRQMAGLDTNRLTAAADEILRQLSSPVVALQEEAVRAAARGSLLHAVPALRGMLPAADEALRQTICRALAVLAPREGGAENVPVLADRAGTDVSSRVRHAAADGLVAIHTEAALAELLRLRESANPPVRALAAGSIAAWGDPALASAVHPLLDDDVPEVACAAADALAVLKNAVSEPPLIARLAKKPGQVQIRVALALGALRSTAALPALTTLFGSEDDRCSAAAATAMGQIGDPTAIPVLRVRVEKVRWQEMESRREALRSLRKLDAAGLEKPIFRIATEKVVPPPPMAPGPMYDLTETRIEALRYLAEHGTAAQGEALLTAMAELPPTDLRLPLAETVTKLTGRNYVPLPDQDHLRYFVESLGPAPYKSAPDTPASRWRLEQRRSQAP